MNLKDFGVSINEVIRYGYGGFLLFLLTAAVEPDFFDRVRGSLGDVLTIISAFAIGSVIYIFYRPIIGEWILYWLCKRLHRKKRSAMCKLCYLEERHRVSRENSVNAYRLVRDKLFVDKARERYHRQHSEIHLLYVSFTVLLGFSLFVCIKWFAGGYIAQPLRFWDVLGLTIPLLPTGLSFLALLCALTGMVADVHLCEDECAYMRSLNQRYVRQLLEGADLARW